MATSGSELPMIATPENCSGRTFVITGANTGLGFETAQYLVANGAAKLIMGCRNVDSGKKAQAKIEAATGKTGVLEVWEVDLLSYASVKAFVKRAATDLDRIDAFIANAGVFNSQKFEAEGHLATTTVNVLSTFLMAVLFLPKLSECAKKFAINPRIVILASNMGFWTPADWEAIKEDPIVKLDQWDRDVQETYALTKVIDVIVALRLAELAPVSRTGVIINVISPGLCATELDRHGTPELLKIIDARRALFGRTAEEGSRTIIHAALSGQETHGHYLDSCKLADETIPEWLDQASRDRTWDVVAAELESAEPGCLKTIL